MTPKLLGDKPAKSARGMARIVTFVHRATTNKVGHRLDMYWYVLIRRGGISIALSDAGRDEDVLYYRKIGGDMECYHALCV